MPGIYVNTDWVSPDVGVRGVSGGVRGGSRVIKVMINGQPISFRIETTNWLGRELIPMKAIERIEIIRGPGSALYGANAFLGVVNIITRTGEDFDGASAWLQGSQFLGRDGHSLSLQGGRMMGPVDFFVAVQQNKLNRSGLSVPVTFQDDAWQETRQEFLQTESYDDYAEPFSSFATLKVDLGDMFGADEGDYGYLRTMWNHQELTSSGSFSDWSVQQYDEQTFMTIDQEADSRDVRNTGNRVGLYNTNIRLDYNVAFLDDMFDLTLGMAIAKGGVSRHERLRRQGDDSTDRDSVFNRGDYGYEGQDTFGELYVSLLKDAFEMEGGFLDGVTLVNNLAIILAADVTKDTVNYQESALDAEYISSDLTNKGFLGQLTGSFFNKRLGFILGARTDDHQGADLTRSQLYWYADRVKKVTGIDNRSPLCNEVVDGTFSKTNLQAGSVCYKSTNYRGGLTLSLLKDVGEFGDDGSILNNLYAKVLYGTAFKAPAPSYLYDDGSVKGDTAILAFPGLLPQEVTSLEYLLGLDLLDNAMNISLVYFNNSMSNKTGFKATLDALYAFNSLDVNTSGLEMTMRLKINIVDFSFGYSKQTSERVADEETELSFTETVAFPQTMMNANLTLDLHWVSTYVNVEFQQIGERTGWPLNFVTERLASENRYTLDAYNLVNVSISSYPLNLFDEDSTTKISLTIRNALEEEFVYPGFQPSYGIDLPGEPRNMFVSVEQSF